MTEKNICIKYEPPANENEEAKDRIKEHSMKIYNELMGGKG